MLTIISTTLISILLSKLIKKENKSKSLLVFLPILILIVFRWNMAPDTNWGEGSYYFNYYNIVHGLENLTFKDPFFYIILQLLSCFKISYWGVLAILGSIYVLSFCTYIWKYSENRSLSIFLFTGLGLLTLSFGALRQALAETFILLAYHYLIDKNHNRKKKAYIFLAIGGFIHASTWFLIPIFAFCNKKWTFNGMIIICGASILLFPIIAPLLRIILANSIFANRYLTYEGEFTFSYFILAIFLLFLLIPFSKKIEKIYVENYLEINFMFTFFMIIIYSIVLIDVFRLISLITPFFLISIPKIIGLYKNKTTKRIMIIGLIIIVSLIFINTNKDVQYISIFPNYIEYIKQI